MINLFKSVTVFLIFGFNCLYAGGAVVADDQAYYKYHKDNIEIIYTKNNLPFANHVANIQTELHSDYENFFGWKLDETLYIGLISEYNQVANAFSSQGFNNRQINYVGGTQLIDYMSSKSWLDTLLYHETAHNYQGNIKGNVVSKSLHSVFGNGSVLVPFLVSPNVMENSFLIEGNAVLNESWHGNGGRLYSGRFKAETLLQAKAGNIKPSYVYNVKLDFPYAGNIWYIQGGFYNLYLAQKYGLKNVNSYFNYHSKDFIWPQFTNGSMQAAVGVDFEASLDEFSKDYAKMADSMVLAKGENIASSQYFYSLSNNKDEIFFIANESGVSEPELVIVDKHTSNINKKRDSWLSGKVIKADKKFYTQGGKHTSPTRIYQGLFDSDGFIKDGTKSKMVQGYLSDGTNVYFDVASSYSEAQLYVGKEFYAQVNSSVIIDKDDNLYYFIQEGKSRVLYKNKIPLYSYKGFYGIVADVESEGGVYFVANSEYGSTLFAFKDGQVFRASDADNILEARLINDKEVLIAAVSEKDYYYVKNEIKKIEEIPFETKLFFEDEEYYGVNDDLNSSEDQKLDLSNPYLATLDMYYKGTDLSMTIGNDVTTWSLNSNFADPLSQNSATVFVNKDESHTIIGGASYTNSEYLLQYEIFGYGVIANNDKGSVRDGGIMLDAKLPLYKSGYYSGNFAASYFQDYSAQGREPISVSLDFSRSEKYGLSMYENYLSYLKVYGAREREDTIYGAKYKFKYSLPYEFYFGLEAKHSQTNSNITDITAIENSRGVKITNVSYQLEMDPSTILVTSLNSSRYIKVASYAEVSLAKVINFSSYWFTFPLSLQRESIYTKYRYYDLEDFSSKKYNFSEITAGFTVFSVVLNKFIFPVNFEYINNNADFIEDKNKFRFMVGGTF